MSEASQRRGVPIRSISAILPAYNVAPHIVPLVEALLDVLHDAAPEFEIIVVDDGSEDATPRLLANLGERVPALRVVRHPRRQGYGRAWQSGIAAAGKQYILLIDTDRQYDPAAVAVFTQWGDRFDVVAGFRSPRRGPAYRAALGWCLRLLVRLLFGIRARDVNCGVKLFRSQLLKGMNLQSRTGFVHAEALYRATRQRATIHEVPVTAGPRRITGGIASRLATAWRAASDLLALRRRIALERRTPPPGQTPEKA